MPQLTADDATGATALAGAPGSPCHACPGGRVGSWARLRAGGHTLLLAELVVVGRCCDRCGALELRAHPRPEQEKKGSRSAAPGSQLLSGVLHNLSAAAAELIRVVRKRSRGT